MPSYLQTAFAIANVIVPKGGPKVIPTALDFSNAAEISMDGELIVSQGGIEYIQGVFIDNADNPDKFSLNMEGVNQRIVCPANSQGYFSIMATNPPKMIASTVQTNGRIINVYFYNVPIQSAVWSVGA